MVLEHCKTKVKYILYTKVLLTKKIERPKHPLLKEFIMNTKAMQKVYIAKIKDMKDYKIAEFIYN